MDKLDRISIWAIVLLVISSSALISHHMGEARPRENRDSPHFIRNKMGAVPIFSNSETEGLLRTARNLMDGGSLDKAEALVREVISKYPYEAELHMVLGDIFMRRQEPVKAVLEYKEAVDLNPDYLDRKTPLFQGKKLKLIVKEALSEIEGRTKAGPGNELLKKYRKDIYYLQRRIAGSCG